jgi:hypothetical protein
MSKINQFIILRSALNDITAELHKELKKTFPDNAQMMAKIGFADWEKDLFDYTKISEQPDEKRAIRIAKEESCSILYSKDVIELIVRVCNLPHSTAKEIVETHFSQF